MNTLTIVLIAVALVVVALPFIVALFISKEYNIKKEITIDKPKKDVFNYVKFIRNQDFYSKWVMTDPSMKKEFRGIDGTVGFVYGWDGNKKAGKGEQEITRVAEGEAIDLEVRFARPFEAVAKTPMRTESIAQNQTKVIWGMEGKSKYPMNFMNLFMEGMVGKDLEASLLNLKNILER
jgi:uncharacterized protein YndB with AHSA1/START domain